MNKNETYRVADTEEALIVDHARVAWRTANSLGRRRDGVRNNVRLVVHLRHLLHGDALRHSLRGHGSWNHGRRRCGGDGCGHLVLDVLLWARHG